MGDRSASLVANRVYVMVAVHELIAVGRAFTITLPILQVVLVHCIFLN